jgi:hypothetical protein
MTCTMLRACSQLLEVWLRILRVHNDDQADLLVVTSHMRRPILRIVQQW